MKHKSFGKLSSTPFRNNLYSSQVLPTQTSPSMHACQCHKTDCFISSSGVVSMSNVAIISA